MENPNEKDLDRLNSFLQGELSAVETYRQCIEKMDDPLITTQLRQLLQSHEVRAQKLSQKIRTLGGTPPTSSGVWGTFAKLVEGGAALFGKASAISTLEEGEDHGKKQYARDVAELSPSLRTFVEQDIIPEQRRTHDVLSALQKSF
jgi:uncharacterized protein (TIGR02284 family)